MHYGYEFINTYVKNESYDESSLQQQFTSFTRYYFSPSQHVFTANSPEIDFMIKLQAENPNIFNGALLYFTNQGMSYSDRSSINGYLLAYEFTHRENSVLFSRRETDKRYINDIRNKIETLENDYQNKVISLIRNIEDDYTKNNDFQTERVSESRKLLANWLHYKRNKFSSFINHTDKEFKDLFETTDSEFTSLQNQYSELLKLEEPVKYWKDWASELNKKANNMMWVLGSITFVAVILTYFLLWQTPEGMLESIFRGDTSVAIRWSIVFALFISFIAFMFRAVMKFMFSNYHLARDAEEREKLTYLYISLLSKGDFSEEEKKIVFQTLFSRSDTGLLKDDSAPTMPSISSVIEKVK
jgi:polyhydroxyalkanoate synthesis regulator phasin